MEFSGIVVLLALYGIAVSLILAVEFREIAEAKGYEGLKCILIPLFCGIGGYIWIMALPKKIRIEKTQLNNENIESTTGTYTTTIISDELPKF